MNAVEDKNLSRETKKGLYLFLQAERLRHMQDIEKIQSMQERLIDELGLTAGEFLELDVKAKKYREF